ncbi:hypothetical protein [Amycolatopsis decaplanina]|uniref:Lipoprotein n=1 Tax=Amycolatopsis decaplanina DSM 44594 TaxID=1284240 RepID=M2YPP9_9PSEU|nr:hypothetical protein [Amycolatopsis decaplanina]EME50743.1 hypothetical protein H074_37933 [Amycolatopsis decaplanina DSM 44594]
MTRRSAPVLAVASLALLSACGPRYDEATTEPVPSPAPTSAAEREKAPSDLAGKVQYDIKGRAEDMIGGPNPGLTLQCGEFSGQSLSCSARLKDQIIQIDARVYDYSPGLALDTYRQDITPKARFLLRDQVHREFHESIMAFQNGDPLDADDVLRCDKMPEVTTVRLGVDDEWVDTGIRCYHYGGTLTTTKRLNVMSRDINFYD